MSHALIALRHWLACIATDPRDDRGASLVEYALLVVLIAVVCAIAVGVFGTTLSSHYSSTASGFG